MTDANMIFDEHFGRSGLDRRTGDDRRRATDRAIIDNRSGWERRDEEERREGWVKVSKYSSAFIGIPIDELV